MDDENELSLIRNKKETINYKLDNLGKNVYVIPEDDEEDRL